MIALSYASRRNGTWTLKSEKKITRLAPPKRDANAFPSYLQYAAHRLATSSCFTYLLIFILLSTVDWLLRGAIFFMWLPYIPL